MDTSSQIEDVMRAWITAQQQLMTGWMDTMRGLSAGQGSTGWSDFVTAWQQSVTQGLDMQADWFHRWSEGLVATEGIPEPVREQIRTGQEMVQTWTRAQKELWQNWFEAMKSASPATDTGTMARAGQNMQHMWGEVMQGMIDTQTAWTRRWMTAMGGSQSGR